MSKPRIHRKKSKSPEEVAREQALRDEIQKQRPTLDQLSETGDFTDPVTQAEYWELLKIGKFLKAMRESQGLSLADLSERMGMDRAAISRLENYGNPTVNTLHRYAHSLGKEIVVRASVGGPIELRLVDTTGNPNATSSTKG